MGPLSHTLAIGAVIAAAGHAAAEEHVVKMAGSQYSPQALTIASGGTVRFVNDGTENHDVFVPTAGLAFDLGTLKPGEEASYTFVKAGTYDIECVFHASMLTVVEVQ